MNKELQSPYPQHGALWWVGRLFIGLAVLLLIVLMSMLWASAQAKADLKAQSSSSGAMVDVDGYRLHLFCEGSSRPTVIMESGKGDSSLLWSLIRPASIKTTLTCVYDRASLGNLGQN